MADGMNYNVSCSVCGHIAYHDKKNKVLEDRSCSSCGYCLRKKNVSYASNNPNASWNLPK